MAADQSADQLAVTAVVLRYFELVDTKAWDQMDEVFTDDTTARWTPDSIVTGREGVVAAMQHMVGSDEIITFHHVSAMVPTIDGDEADVRPRVRAMHYGLGARAGQFYESLAIQPTHLVRSSAGWRIGHHDWKVSIKLGDFDQLFAPEIAAGKRH